MSRVTSRVTSHISKRQTESRKVKGYEACVHRERRRKGKEYRGVGLFVTLGCECIGSSGSGSDLTNVVIPHKVVEYALVATNGNYCRTKTAAPLLTQTSNSTARLIPNVLGRLLRRKLQEGLQVDSAETMTKRRRRRRRRQVGTSILCQQQLGSRYSTQDEQDSNATRSRQGD